MQAWQKMVSIALLYDHSNCIESFQMENSSKWRARGRSVNLNPKRRNLYWNHRQHEETRAQRISTVCAGARRNRCLPGQAAQPLAVMTGIWGSPFCLNLNIRKCKVRTRPLKLNFRCYLRGRRFSKAPWPFRNLFAAVGMYHPAFHAG